ncbi:MAG: glutaredoxin family protein [Gallionella sp.]
MKRIVLSLCCLAFMSLFAQAGELYRWVDKAGRMHYGDVPPADGTQVEIRKFSAGKISNEYIPYETRNAQLNFPVTLYVGISCGEICNQARSLLNKRGIPFAEKELRIKEDIDAFRKLTGSEGVPTLAVGKTYLQGFQSGQWHSELDIAGYPKIPPYRAPNIQPATPAAETPVTSEYPIEP